jgi:peptidoglycan/LPS O-acetylase OafA/YrhL
MLHLLVGTVLFSIIAPRVPVLSEAALLLGVVAALVTLGTAYLSFTLLEDPLRSRLGRQPWLIPGMKVRSLNAE